MDHKHIFDTILEKDKPLACGDCLINKRGVFKHSNAGRPCEYCNNKEEIDKITKEYIQEAINKRKTKEGFIPYLQELAILLDCDSDRVSLWANKKNDEDKLEHEEFHGLIKKLNNTKELLLLKRTTGRFNPTGAIFQLKTKHGYIETEKTILAGSQNTDEKIQIEFIEAKPLPGETNE